MKRFILGMALMGIGAGPALADGGIVSVPSRHDVATTTDRLVAALEKRGVTVFARIDHAAGARKVGKSLPPTQLVIFGNPKLGTPLMQCARSTGIDLPMKALIWRDADGGVWFSYNEARYLDERHGLGECGHVVKKVANALQSFAGLATRKE